MTGIDVAEITTPYPPFTSVMTTADVPGPSEFGSSIASLGPDPYVSCAWPLGPEPCLSRPRPLGPDPDASCAERL